MSEKEKMVEIPAAVVDLAEKVKKERQEEERELTQKEEKEEKRRAKIRRNRIKDSEEYAKAVFEWAEAFRRDKTGIQLIDTGHPIFSGNGVIFFDGNIEGEASRRLGVSSKGLWWVGTGCGARPSYIRTPEELAAEVEPEVLKLVCQWIEDGRVWECIERIFKW